MMLPLNDEDTLLDTEEEVEDNPHACFLLKILCLIMAFFLSYFVFEWFLTDLRAYGCNELRLERPWQVFFDRGPLGPLLRDRFGAPDESNITLPSGRKLVVFPYIPTEVRHGAGVWLKDPEKRVPSVLIRSPWRHLDSDQVNDQINWALEFENVKK